MLENVLVIDEYATPGDDEYLHTAASFVVRESVACVVPEGRVPVGCPLEQPGGVISVERENLTTIPSDVPPMRFG